MPENQSLRLKSIQDVVHYGLCISCGACVSAAPKGTIKMRYDRRRGLMIPTIESSSCVDGKGIEFDVCPGKGVPLLHLASQEKNKNALYDINLGFIHNVWAMHSNNSTILENASSGGIMTAIADYLLSTKKVQGIISTKMSYGPNGPYPQTIIAESLKELLACQGSKYCPVPANLILKDLDSYDGVVAFIGTPCQIAGLRMLQERNRTAKIKVRFVIGNFCGGTKSFKDMHAMINRQGFNTTNVVRFRYRGGGQPGSLLIEDNTGRIKTRPYPAYTGDTGYKKLDRCRLCIDGTAELADFSCGDAWLPRFESQDSPWSVCITRNYDATHIINEMARQGLITLCDLTLQEVILSQNFNLSSKKTRQAARRKLYQLLRKPIPSFDGGYPQEESSLLLEIKVHLRHSLFSVLERTHLYVPFKKASRQMQRGKQICTNKRM